MARQMPQISFDIVSHRQGHSVVEKAAYNARAVLYDEHRDVVYHQHSTREDLVTEAILTPNGAPEWMQDRERYWNAYQRFEYQKRSDPRFARSAVLPLPRELDEAQNMAFLKDFLNENFVKRGYVVDVAVHYNLASDQGDNLHAHVLVSDRAIGADGEFMRTKDRTMNSVKTLEGWRASWEDLANQHIAMAGLDSQVTIQSYEAQGIAKTGGVHLGPRGWEVAQREGDESYLADYNRRAYHLDNVRPGMATIPETFLHLDGMPDTSVSGIPMDESLLPHEQALLRRVQNQITGLNLELLNNPHYLTWNDMLYEQQGDQHYEQADDQLWQPYLDPGGPRGPEKEKGNDGPER